MAWITLLYVFTAFLGGLLIFYIFSKPTKPKGSKNSPLKRYKEVCQKLPTGTKKGWGLIAVEHGLRLWEKSELVDGSMFASSTILPVSLEILMKILTNPSIVREWDPWVNSVSRISMSNDKESSQLSGDVISVTQAPNSSSKVIEAFDTLACKFFKSDSKLHSRVWNHEENIQCWLYSAVVDPRSSDPVYTLFIAFPIKEMKDQCEVTVVCDAMPSFNPCSLTAKLAGLKDYVVCSQSEVVYPETDETDSVLVDDEDQELEEIQDNQNEAPPGEECKPPSEAFVDVTGVYLRPEKDVQKYKVAIDNAIKKLMECYNAKTGDNGWAFVGNVKDIEILKKPASPGFSIWDCAKGTGKINVPVHYLITYVRDLEHTGEYDDMFNTGHIIEDLGGLTNISYTEYKAIWPVSGRDFCAFNAIRILPDDIYVVVARSIKHPSCPPCKKYVRGKILIGGFVIKELSKDPPCSLVTYVTHVDLAGSVPSRIVNKVTANQPQSVALVKHFAEKMYQEELDNPDRTSKFKEDAMGIFEKLERARNVVESAKSTERTETLDEQPLPPVPVGAVASTNGDVRRSVSQMAEQSPTPTQIHASASAPQFHSPTIELSPFDNINVDYKTIGNQSSAGLLQEVFEVAEVDIAKPGGSSGTVHEQWEYRGMEKEVMMFRKIHSNEKMHSIIGKGIIPCSPSKVWEILKDPKQRYNYDNMLKETRILERISKYVAIEYLHFETANCFQKQARDFVVLRTERKEKDKYLLSVMSIDYQNSPVKKDVKRGKILASGWVVEPMLHNGQLYSLVTYLSQVNPGGNYPANLINLVAKKQPLCVAYLRRYLQNPSFVATDSSE